MSKKLTIVAVFSLIFIILGSFLVINNDNSAPDASEQNKTVFPFLANRLVVDSPSETIINFSNLWTSFNSYFKDNNLKGSLYFEYLPTGTSIRINCNDD